MKRSMKNATTLRILNQYVPSIVCYSILLVILVAGLSAEASAQSLSWLAPSSLGVTISGVPGRPSPAAAVYNGQMYVAFTSTVSAGDPQPNNLVYVGSGTGLTYSAFAYVNPNGGEASSNANPSLAAFNGRLWLAFNAALPSGEESADIVSMGPDGQWGTVDGLPAGNNLAYSPSLATDGTYLYAGLVQQNGTMTLCKGDGINPFTCQNLGGAFPGDVLGYNPGLAVYNGVLYAGWVTNDNSHDMYYYVSTNQGASFTKSSALTGSQSSCAPHLGVHNGILWYDVRTNDGAHKFSQRFSTNGSSWASGADAHIAMGGEPTVVDGAGLNIFAGEFYLFFTSNDGTNTLNVTYGN